MLIPASPTWLLKDDPEISRSNGVWGMIRRIRATPHEGLPALWKGQLISTVHAVASTLLQPRVHNLVFSLFPSSATGSSMALPLDFPLTALPHPAVPLALQVASHALTQFLLSPLELVRTRLIAMPTSHPSTPSSLTILRRAIADEGGISGLYFASNVMLPALLEHTLRPLLTMSIPLILERGLGFSADLAPISYSLAALGMNVAALLVILPIETVRCRLQLQSRAPGGGKPFRSVVPLRERDYVGIVEAIWRIITEETAAPRKKRMTEREEGGWFSGVCQLYRGVSLLNDSKFELTSVRHGCHRTPHSVRPRPRQRRVGRKRPKCLRLWMEGDLIHLMHCSHTGSTRRCTCRRPQPPPLH